MIPPDITAHHVASGDGTMIGFQSVATGARPGLVLLHGAMEWSHSHLELARALSGRYTVHLPDRRGRGRSGAYQPPYRTAQDVEDMAAVLSATGARLVMGVSSGALVWLHTLLAVPTVERAVLFEPPLLRDLDRAAALVARVAREIEDGDLDAALVTGMLGAEMGPAAMRRLPRGLLTRLTAWGAGHEQRRLAARPRDGYVTMRDLAPTLRQDFALVAATSGRLDLFQDVRARVLLLGGARSPDYLRQALDALERVLSAVERVELPGVGHEVTGNADRRGRPERVAPLVEAFLGG